MKNSQIAVFAAALLLAGCASYSGSSLVPGKSTEVEVVDEMGAPALALAQPGGGRALYFPRQPFGRQTYVASIGSSGVLSGIRQVLTQENIRRIAVDRTSGDQVRELLGPPEQVVRYALKPNQEVWEYPWQLGEDKRLLWVTVSDDGIVRNVADVHDFDADPPSGPGDKD
jgi:hypothetical protein